MSNPYLKQAKSTYEAKMRHTGVKEREDDRDRAKRMVKGYAGGGAVHSDIAEDKKLIRQEVKPSALKD